MSRRTAIVLGSSAASTGGSVAVHAVGIHVVPVGNTSDAAFGGGVYNREDNLTATAANPWALEAESNR